MGELSFGNVVALFSWFFDSKSKLQHPPKKTWAGQPVYVGRRGPGQRLRWNGLEVHGPLADGDRSLEAQLPRGLPGVSRQSDLERNEAVSLPHHAEVSGCAVTSVTCLVDHCCFVFF